MRVYEWNGTTWNQVGSDINGNSGNEGLGFSLAFSDNGEILAVGSPSKTTSASVSGEVKVYQWDGSNWVHRGSSIEGVAANNNAGTGVDISGNGNFLVVGSPGNSDQASQAGHVRVFEWDGMDWVQRGSTIYSALPAMGDFFGQAVAITDNGNRLVVGAPSDDTSGGVNSGSLSTFNWIGTDWVATSQLITGLEANANLGSRVGIGSNGNYMVVSSPGAAGGAGQVQAYEWSSIWQPWGVAIEGEAANDRSGSELAVSPFGGNFAVGAPNNNGAGSNAGHVRSFNVSYLPVELVEFRGALAAHEVNLYWTTASEIRNEGFRIQRFNNDKWEEIGYVSGGTPGSYKFSDAFPQEGVNYYRLKQEDVDGRFEFSKVISITKSSSKMVRIAPNPSNGQLNIYIDQPISTFVYLNLTDSSGKLIWQKCVKQPGKHHLTLDKGVYFFYSQSNNTQTVEKIIVY